MSEFVRWKADEAKRFLRSVEDAKRRLDVIAVSIADIYAEMEGIRAIDYSRAGVSGGIASDPLASILADKDERMREYQSQAHDLECKIRRAAYVIGRMPNQTYAAILDAHYLCGLSWTDVASSFHYSLRWLASRKDEAHASFYDAMSAADKVELPDALE